MGRGVVVVVFVVAVVCLLGLFGFVCFSFWNTVITTGMRIKPQSKRGRSKIRERKKRDANMTLKFSQYTSLRRAVHTVLICRQAADDLRSCHTSLMSFVRRSASPPINMQSTHTAATRLHAAAADTRNGSKNQARDSKNQARDSKEPGQGVKGYSHSLTQNHMRHVRNESAREQRTALYKSYE